MKIIVVGNGSSNLTKRRGELVDDYDKVIRINDYVVDGFESFVGTKTNIWAMDTKVFDCNIEYPKRFEAIDEIWILPSFAFSGSRAEIFNRLSKRTSNMYISDFTMVGQLQNDVEAFPSTGVQTLQTAISKFSDALPIDIMGFDHFTGRVIDYWDKKWKQYVPHTGAKEKQYVENKIREKKLCRI
jgi:hypothetical protein